MTLTDLNEYKMYDFEVGAPPSPSPIFGGSTVTFEPSPIPTSFFPSNMSAVVAEILTTASSSSSSSSDYLLPTLLGISALVSIGIGFFVYRQRKIHPYQSIPTEDIVI